jgi:glycosyltransferase involved in cell wall biosynthesis
MRATPIVITIPVKNEETLIGACIDALAAQTIPFTRLVLLLNNCTDATPNICRQRQAHIANIDILDVTLPPAEASAGHARRLAWRHAAAFAEGGVILTTDADAQPPRSWIAQNLQAFESGADVVCGMAALHPADAGAIRQGVHFDELREGFLLSLLDEITAWVDPDQADPWPRHQQHSGASIALTEAVLRRAGGAPGIAAGEDRALIERLRRVDARIRHAPDICVRVSGRLEGRADGGMAAALKRRAARQDVLTDETLEPAVDAYRRALTRARLRPIFAGAGDAAAVAEDLLIDPATLRRALETEYFGAAWVNVQAASPVLQRRRVGFAELARETRLALRLRDEIRANLPGEPAATWMLDAGR